MDPWKIVGSGRWVEEEEEPWEQLANSLQSRDLLHTGCGGEGDRAAEGIVEYINYRDKIK